MAFRKNVKYSLFRNFGFAIEGIFLGLTNEMNLRIQFGFAFLVCLAGYYFNLKVTEWCIILFCIAAVIGFELLNSALEAFMDAIHPDQHIMIGKAKDMAAGAVLMMAIVSAIIGSLIFWPHFCTF